jgi:hypothetical protein
MSCYCGDCPQCNGTLHGIGNKASKALAKTEPMQAVPVPLNVKSLIAFISDYPKEWKALSNPMRDRMTDFPQEFILKHRDHDSIHLSLPDIIFRGLLLRFTIGQQWIIESIIE